MIWYDNTKKIKGAPHQYFYLAVPLLSYHCLLYKKTINKILVSLVRLFVNALYGASRRIVHLLERGVPGQGLGCWASHRGNAWHAEGGASWREVLLEDWTVVIFLLVHWSINTQIFQINQNVFNLKQLTYFFGGVILFLS